MYIFMYLYIKWRKEVFSSAGGNGCITPHNLKGLWETKITKRDGHF